MTAGVPTDAPTGPGRGGPGAGAGDDARMPLRDYATVVAQRHRVVLATIAAALALATAACALVTPKFTATASLALAIPSDIDKRDPANLNVVTTDLIKSCLAFAGESAVLRPAARSVGIDLDAEPVAPDVHARARRDSAGLDVSVTDVSATRSARLADAVAAQTLRLCNDLAPTLNPGNRRVLSFVVTGNASVPTADDPPRWGLSLLLALVIGALAGIAAAVAADAVRPQLRSPSRPPGGPPVLGRLRPGRPLARATLGHRVEELRRGAGRPAVLVTSTSRRGRAVRVARELGEELASARTPGGGTPGGGAPDGAAVVLVEDGRTPAVEVADEAAQHAARGARVLGIVVVG